MFDSPLFAIGGDHFFVGHVPRSIQSALICTAPCAAPNTTSLTSIARRWLPMADIPSPGTILLSPALSLDRRGCATRIENRAGTEDMQSRPCWTQTRITASKRRIRHDLLILPPRHLIQARPCGGVDLISQLIDGFPAFPAIVGNCISPTSTACRSPYHHPPRSIAPL